MAMMSDNAVTGVGSRRSQVLPEPAFFPCGVQNPPPLAHRDATRREDGRFPGSPTRPPPNVLTTDGIARRPKFSEIFSVISLPIKPSASRHRASTTIQQPTGQPRHAKSANRTGPNSGRKLPETLDAVGCWRARRASAGACPDPARGRGFARWPGEEPAPPRLSGGARRAPARWPTGWTGRPAHWPRAACQEVPLLVASPLRRSRAAVSPYRLQRNQSRKVFLVWA